MKTKWLLRNIEAQIPHIHVSNDDLYFIITTITTMYNFTL